MNKIHFFNVIDKTFSECREILEKKNHDYSVGEDALRNFKAASLVGLKPEDGILIRMTDKLVRISNLLKHDAKVSDEAMEDTIKDLMNYSAILLALLSENSVKENSSSVVKIGLSKCCNAPIGRCGLNDRALGHSLSCVCEELMCLVCKDLVQD